MQRAWPLAACFITGAALYAGRGVLDVVLVNGQPVRVALLPPWESLLGFLLLAGLGFLLLDRLNRVRRPAADRVPLGSLVAPAAALAVLLIPFTPVLPDRWPAVQALAGPMGWLVWLGVGGLLFWTWWQHRLIAAGWLARRSLGQLAVMIGMATAALSGTTAARLTSTVLFPAGDEPHYLIISQSLWRDGDFKIENNHQQGDYREYFPRDLDPHYLTRGADGEIYSIHPVGLPIVLAPVYALGGYRAVLLALIAMAAAAAGLMWRAAAAATGSRGAATFAWAVIAGSAPFLFNSFTVYPEIGAALAVMVAITTRHPVVLGLACGVLPWLSTKYAPMSAVLLVTGTVPVTNVTGTVPVSVSAIARAVGPYGVLLAAWFAFFYWIWGTPMPQAPYGAMVQTTPWNLVFGAPGLLFDQEYGLLPYAPAYILAATGLWGLWRSGGDRRWTAVRVVLVFGALLGTVGAFRIWWGGSASPGRPLASGLLVLGLPIAAAFSAAPVGSARRASQHLLMWIGAGITLTMTFAQEGFLIANGRDGTSSLLEWWSPRWELWTLAPSFIHHEAPIALAHALAWLVVAGLAAWGLARVRTRTPGMAALAATAILAGGLLAASAILPVLPDDPPTPRVNLQARSRLPALDWYDLRARPAAVVFDPLRKTSAADLLPGMTLGVSPGLRTDPQPVRVLHNGRFSLPAGDYRVDVRFTPGRAATGGDISLQVGRVGGPVHTWPIPTDAETFRQVFHLPLDAPFVGFRGSRELEAAIEAITITPVSIVNTGERVRAPVVLGAAMYGSSMVLLHDDQVAPEPDGFWVLGRRPTMLSIAPAEVPGAGATLRLRSRVDNTATLRTHGWMQTVALSADQAQDVPLPAPEHGVVELTVTTSGGFSPIDIDPASRDRRYLGVWVEVVNGVP